jgi:hypothetical protein
MNFQLFSQIVPINIDFPVLKIKLSRNFFGSRLSVDLPVLFAFTHPFFHECLVFFEFLHVILSLTLLDALQHIGLS